MEIAGSLEGKRIRSFERNKLIPKSRPDFNFQGVFYVAGVALKPYQVLFLAVRIIVPDARHILQ